MNEEEIRLRLMELHTDSYVWALRCSDQDRLAAEEILQSVYVKILEGRAVFGGKSSFKTWLFSVIRFTALDFRRDQMRRLTRQNNYLDQLERYAGDYHEPDQRIDRLRKKVAELPARQQEVMELLLGHDMTLAEIAGVLNITVGSVRQHYDRGKKKIRELLSKPTRVQDEEIR